MKFVCVSVAKPGCEAERGEKARLHMNHHQKPEPPLNPPKTKRDPFAVTPREAKEPQRIRSPAKSTLRGDVKEDPKISNADILAFLKANLQK
jgi:hypothetical protein